LMLSESFVPSVPMHTLNWRTGGALGHEIVSAHALFEVIEKAPNITASVVDITKCTVSLCLFNKC